MKFGEEKEGIFSKVKNSSFLSILKIEMPLISSNEEEENLPNITDNSLEKILNSQLAMMYNLKENGEIDDTKLENGSDNLEVIESQNNNEDIQITDVPENLATQVISENNINASFTDEENGIKVNNQTGFNIKDIIANANYNLSNKDKVVIYHTHTCESYTSSANYEYQMTGAYRTTDLNFTVSRVGDELDRLLTENGKTVIHDKTYHDYPAYNGSYGRSLKTLEKVLKDNNDAEITIDLHRDAVRKQ